LQSLDPGAGNNRLRPGTSTTNGSAGIDKTLPGFSLIAAQASPAPGYRPDDGRKGGKNVIAATARSGNDAVMSARTVLIAAFDGVQSLDITGPLEVLTGASRYQAGRGQPARPIRSWSGAWAACRSAPPAGSPWSPILTCEPRRATTHWSASDALARRFPDVLVDPEPIYLRDGNVVTSAGVTAGIDMALALVEEDLGRAAALAVARQLVVFLRRPGSQAQFSAQLRAQVAQRRPLREVQQWITERPAADLSVDRLATRAGLSARQFARAFAAETGVTPGQYVGKVRLEAARRLLAPADLVASMRARSRRARPAADPWLAPGVPAGTASAPRAPRSAPQAPRKPPAGPAAAAIGSALADCAGRLLGHCPQRLDGCRRVVGPVDG